MSFARAEGSLRIGQSLRIFFVKFSPSLYKRRLHAWRLFGQCMPATICAVCKDGDPRTWEHFVSRLGFVPMGMEVTCNNGAQRQLFISVVTADLTPDQISAFQQQLGYTNGNLDAATTSQFEAPSALNAGVKGTA